MSIKFKITLYYTLLMIAVCASVLAFIIRTGNVLTETSSKEKLVSALTDAVKEVDWDDGEIEIDKDLQFYTDGVYILVYTSGTLYDGISPDSTIRDLPLSGGTDGSEVIVRNEVSDDDEERFLVADVEVTFKKHESIWVRGAVSLSGADSAISGVTEAAVLTLPVIVIAAAVIGYLVTRRAFAPVSKITETAVKISSSGDLRARIGLKQSNKRDEIVNLAAAFDSMLDKVEKSFEAEKQFTSDASHELRTPVSVITSQAEYALDLIEQNGAAEISEVEKSLSVILRKSERMTSLISQLLTLARADRGAEKLVTETIDLTELIRSAAAEFADSPMAAEGNISVSFSENGENVKIKGDRSMISRMVENLISNAVKFNRDGGTVEVSVKLKPASGSDKTKKTAVIDITDTGIGINPDEFEKIFDRFYQTDKSRSSGNVNNTGMGLGLAMVKWIAETAHGGKVSVKSEIGKGSTFSVELPEAK